MQMFRIEADRLYWIKGDADDPEDFCLHGHVTVRIGDVRIEDDCTVSATAMCLLRTLTEDHIPQPDGAQIQMLPCCGHFLVANEDLTNVYIDCCPYGTDWAVIHEGDSVRLKTEGGEDVLVPMEGYRREVCRFADRIEAYYASCTPKIEPEDEFQRNGRIAFWNEWHRRREG